MRRSGVLMHISSLPSPYGIGTLGKAAYDFVDFLWEAKQKYWQVLPVNPTGYGDSPYQSFSVFAGNPYFIDLELLQQEGLLLEEEIQQCDFGGSEHYVDYEKMYISRYHLLKLAFSRSHLKENLEYQQFLEENRFWLDDYACYMAIKERFGNQCWLSWDEGIATRFPMAMKIYQQVCSKQIRFQKFMQFYFYRQWKALKQYANEKGILLIGDMPIYVALDSSDVWANPELFQLDQKTKRPIQVAGCPPDGFSPTGQLWGNPLYHWDAMKQNGYQWWIQRTAMASKLFDVIRIDHFRGFDEYYAIPYGDKTAENGHWEQGPGYELFQEIEKALGKQHIIAENLGFLTPSVFELLEKCGFPGMKVLEFAFNPWEDNMYLPHNCGKDSVVYTGTHDNDTVRGWADCMPQNQVEYAMDYLNVTQKDQLPWAFIRAAWGTASQLAIAPMQDILELNNDAKMNTPSTLGWNWKWRMDRHAITPELAHRLRRITEIYQRAAY